MRVDGRADLAVALLVDLWNHGTGAQRQDTLTNVASTVSNETAVLVVNAALTGQDANAQLVAAEVLCRMQVHSLMQGPSEVRIADLKEAASHAEPNPDRVFYKVVVDRSTRLATWSQSCDGTDCRPGALAMATASSAQ